MRNSAAFCLKATYNTLLLFDARLEISRAHATQLKFWKIVNLKRQTVRVYQWRYIYIACRSREAL